MAQMGMVEDEANEDYSIEKVSDEKILEFIKSEEIVTTKEVAEHFDYRLQTSRRRLKKLREEGKTEMKEVGKRLVWWVSNKEMK